MSERKPSEPTSDLNIEILQKLSEYLHPHSSSLIKILQHSVKREENRKLVQS